MDQSFAKKLISNLKLNQSVKTALNILTTVKNITLYGSELLEIFYPTLKFKKNPNVTLDKINQNLQGESLNVYCQRSNFVVCV